MMAPQAGRAVMVAGLWHAPSVASCTTYGLPRLVCAASTHTVIQHSSSVCAAVVVGPGFCARCSCDGSGTTGSSTAEMGGQVLAVTGRTLVEVWSVVRVA